MSPQDSYFEAQSANGIVFGDGALGRWFGLEEAMEWGSCDGIRSLVRRDTRELARSPVSVQRRGQVNAQWDAGRLQATEDALLWNLLCRSLWTWIFSF